MANENEFWNMSAHELVETFKVIFKEAIPEVQDLSVANYTDKFEIGSREFWTFMTIHKDPKLWGSYPTSQ